MFLRLLLSAVSSAFMVVSSWSVAAAADCDFNKRVGNCKAQIEIRSSSGSKGSYSAEIIVRSSAPTCSKVDYYLDNTPQRAILKEAMRSLKASSVRARSREKISRSKNALHLKIARMLHREATKKDAKA
jgi:hypothetical protein